MKVKITNEEFIELYEKSQDINFLSDKPENKSPEYLLAYEFFKALLLVSSATERIKVLESIKANIELIDDE